MKITKTSPLTGEANTREINVTEAQLTAYSSGELIQRAMPQVSPEDREFIITGYTPEDWVKMFPPSCDSCLQATVCEQEILRCGEPRSASFEKEVSDDHSCAYWVAG